MFELIIGLGLLSVALWIGYKITGTLFTVCFWLFIKLPCALIVSVLGLLMCVTIILIPVGKSCFGMALRILE